MTPEQISECFEGLKQALEAQAWFRESGWICDSHGFPEAHPEGLTFHVTKAHWFNQDHHGIHLESWLPFDPAKQKKSFITLHLLHAATIPGTGVKRKRLAQGVVDRIREAIESWPGYVFRAGAYGQQPFSCALDGSSPDFAAELQKQITRLAQTIGPVVDQVLKELEA